MSRSCPERSDERAGQRTCHSQEDTQVDTSLACRGVEAHADARNDDSGGEEKEPRIKENCGQGTELEFTLTRTDQTSEHALSMTVSLLESHQC